MKFPADSPVTAAKLETLQGRITDLKIDLTDIQEVFIRAGGPGGQKVNKTSSGVQLQYPPLNLVIKWTKERSRGLNRFLALRELVDQIEARISPHTSDRLTEQGRIRKQKQRRRRKAKAKA